MKRKVGNNTLVGNVIHIEYSVYYAVSRFCVDEHGVDEHGADLLNACSKLLR